MFDIRSGHRGFLGQAMGDNGNGAPMKEVKESVIDRSKFNPQFINVVAQIVGFGSTKFVTKERESENCGTALVEGFGVGII
jgi:hypothetical protein